MERKSYYGGKDEHTGWYYDLSFNYCESTKPPKPVYTQAMADNHESVPIGADCLWGGHNGNYVPCKILCIDDSQFFMIIDGVHRIVGNPTNFKPIEPPIELENGEFYGFDYSNKSHRGIYSKRDDRFIFVDGHVMASYCKSIKLLKVKS